ncbi:OsmC family protein [Pleionea litopenaei]|uniref:OsmC family protein n=1 Tax=Pleionea litopenaei TaxID=3070815 RepID=A0AA51RWA2_9GAMM|nr:OsmC family protein [Pleionea sp. HL-JVS1]WMS88618.1 OsmC family protein [Pleionea sp. HL-JVS1]
MSNEHSTFEVALKLIDNYRFEVDFGAMGQIETDEPEPLGEGSGPNPTRLLATSVANCLAASLCFAIRKFKGDPGAVTAKVSGELARVEGRWRVAKLAVAIELGQSASDIPHLDRILEQFEAFCVVTESVRAGIPVDVSVSDNNHQVLHQSN